MIQGMIFPLVHAQNDEDESDNESEKSFMSCDSSKGEMEADEEESGTEDEEDTQEDEKENQENINVDHKYDEGNFDLKLHLISKINEIIFLNV